MLTLYHLCGCPVVRYDLEPGTDRADRETRATANSPCQRCATREVRQAAAARTIFGRPAIGGDLRHVTMPTGKRGAYRPS